MWSTLSKADGNGLVASSEHDVQDKIILNAKRSPLKWKNVAHSKENTYLAPKTEAIFFLRNSGKVRKIFRTAESILKISKNI
jgi:hypothetical protein